MLFAVPLACLGVLCKYLCRHGSQYGCQYALSGQRSFTHLVFQNRADEWTNQLTNEKLTVRDGRFLSRSDTKRDHVCVEGSGLVLFCFR